MTSVKIGDRWGDLTDEQARSLPIGTVMSYQSSHWDSRSVSRKTKDNRWSVDKGYDMVGFGKNNGAHHNNVIDSIPENE